MLKLPESVRQAVILLSKLPSLGPRQATRLAFYLLGNEKLQASASTALARALQNLSNVKRCQRCFFVHENAAELCDICGDQNRNHGIILIVEKETDLVSIESTGRYTGRYHVIGAISKNGTLEVWQVERLKVLKDFIQMSLAGQAQEIVLGFNPTTLGDFQASLLTKELGSLTPRLSRLGRGIPTGGEIEFADDDTLAGALESRK